MLIISGSWATSFRGRSRTRRMTAISSACIMERVSAPQSGIFALGTASHAYLEFDLRDEREAPDVALIRQGKAGAGGTILLLQKWVHDAAAWESLPVAHQERVIGRTKLESVELEDRPGDSHVAATDQDRFGKIFRRNMPFGTV